MFLINYISQLKTFEELFFQAYQQSIDENRELGYSIYINKTNGKLRLGRKKNGYKGGIILDTDLGGLNYEYFGSFHTHIEEDADPSWDVIIHSIYDNEKIIIIAGQFSLKIFKFKLNILYYEIQKLQYSSEISKIKDLNKQDILIKKLITFSTTELIEMLLDEFYKIRIHL